MRVKVPAGSQTGQTLRIRGKGIARKDRVTGHLFVHLLVMAPDGPVSEDVLASLQRSYRSDVRAALQESR